MVLSDHMDRAKNLYDTRTISGVKKTRGIR